MSFHSRSINTNPAQDQFVFAGGVPSLVQTKIPDTFGQDINGSGDAFGFDISALAAGTDSQTHTEFAGNSKSSVDMPFQNLDPYDTDGKDALPTGDLLEGFDGDISSQLDSNGGAGIEQIGFEMAMMNYSFVSEAGQLDILELFDSRTSEVATRVFNGEEVPAEYKSGSAFGFEGTYYDDAYRAIHVTMEIETLEEIQSDFSDPDGNLILTSYNFGQAFMLEGQAFDHGISEFTMEFEIAAELVMNEAGTYDLLLSVYFEGEIVDLNGFERYYHFESEIEISFGSLDDVDFAQLPPEFFFEIQKFAAGMGSAWDGLGDMSDHLSAVLMQLKDQGNYDLWDFVDQGLDNPFSFDLPPLEIF